MMKHVLALHEVGEADAASTGAKAAALGALMEAGFPVPRGVCVTTDAFRLAVGQKQSRIKRILLEHDLLSPAGGAEAAARLSELLVDLSVPKTILRALHDALGPLVIEGTPLAVRSSATAEDRPDASFAGQYATVLGVSGEAALESAIVQCWRSFFSPNALNARATYGALSAGEAMGVVVQEMIDAECAGVCFSVDPVRQSRDLVVIDAAWGLGLGAVDGSVATDSYWLGKDGFASERRQIAEKPRKIAMAAGGGVEQQPVPAEQRRAACLPESWARRIAEFAVAAENLKGSPQDLEWAIADRKLWILQSRPVTALPPELVTPEFPVTWQSQDDARLPWRHHLISHRFVPLPLEQEAHDHWLLGMRDAEDFSGRPVGSRAQVINGRTYLAFTPPRLRPGDVRVRQAARRDLQRRLLQESNMTTWDHWGPEVVAATERLKAFDAGKADGPQLAEHLEDALGAFRRHWMVHWLLSHFEPMLGPLLEAYRALTGSPEKPSTEAVMHLLDGEETPLTRLIDGLYALGEKARKHPKVAELVREQPAGVMTRLQELPEAAVFTTQLQAFLNEFGDRTGMGFGSLISLRTPTWREDPTQVLKLAAPYLDPTVPAPSLARRRARERRDAEVAKLASSSENEAAASEFLRQLDLARKEAAVLEKHNHYIDQLSTAQLRAAVLAAAHHLAERGVLEGPDEVFWLTFAEIVAALAAEEPQSMSVAIAARREQHARWSAMEPPPLLGLPKAELDERPPLSDEVTIDSGLDDKLLEGKAASPGSYRGRARVVTGHVTLPEVEPGDVLIAENAGPQWTPVFPILGGLVLDQGALMQHASVTAREYGIPAVIATGTATKRVVDCTMVTVDGTAGTLKLEPTEAEERTSDADAPADAMGGQ